MMNSSAASADGKFGAKPPSSPTLVLWPAFFSSDRRVWKISEPQRNASAKVLAPTGMIMNSWKSIGLSACTPPLMMFIIGTGSGRGGAPADIAVQGLVGGSRGGFGARKPDSQIADVPPPLFVDPAVKPDHG